VEFFVAGGPGGQHRNKTETGVRLHHHPSGLIVTATERRSRAANLDAAWERLRERLLRLNAVPKRRVATRPTGGARRRRLSDKAHAADKKRARRPPPED
jgi:protein subunit release factor B